MRWKPSGKSRNIEDRRGQRTARRRAAPVGLGGIILILVISYVFEINPLTLLQQTGTSGPAQTSPAAPTEPYQSSPQEEELVQFSRCFCRSCGLCCRLLVWKDDCFISRTNSW